MPQPPPSPIPVLEPNPDLVPFDEADPDAPSQIKRGLGEEDDSDHYYALQRRHPSANPAKPNSPEGSWRKPGSGPPRAEYMCSNEFMESVGIVPARPQWNPKFTPENPWQRKPPVPKKSPQQKKQPGRKPKTIPPPADEPGPSPWFGRREGLRAT